jgi:hypothetical protein
MRLPLVVLAFNNLVDPASVPNKLPSDPTANTSCNEDAAEKFKLPEPVLYDTRFPPSPKYKVSAKDAPLDSADTIRKLIASFLGALN